MNLAKPLLIVFATFFVHDGLAQITITPSDNPSSFVSTRVVRDRAPFPEDADTDYDAPYAVSSSISGTNFSAMASSILNPVQTAEAFGASGTQTYTVSDGDFAFSVLRASAYDINRWTFTLGQTTLLQFAGTVTGDDSTRYQFVIGQTSGGNFSHVWNYGDGAPLSASYVLGPGSYSFSASVNGGRLVNGSHTTDWSYTVAIPEPNSVALLIVATGAFLNRRRTMGSAN